MIIQPSRSYPAKFGHAAPWVAMGGLVMLLVGLAWDGLLHSLNPQLAETEGVFTLTNPGHVLFAGGIAVIVAAMLLFMFGRATSPQPLSKVKRAGLFIGAGGLAALAVAVFIIAANSDGGVLDNHSHASNSAVATNIPGAVTPIPTDHSHSSATTAAPSTGQQAAADKLLADVKTGTARFQDYNVAVAEGYKQITPFAPKKYGMAHFHNQGYNSDGQLLDPNKPEDLVYMKLPDGKMVLLGAMFLAPTGQGPQPGGSLTSWHTHDNLCLGAGKVSQASGGTCPTGTTKLQQEMMHVWTFNNPDEAFSHNITAKAFLAAVKYATGR